MHEEKLNDISMKNIFRLKIKIEILENALN